MQCIFVKLTSVLQQLFGWQTFKRVGASLAINRIYKLVLSLSIVLQLSFFFTGVTVSLWLDNLINGVAAQVVWYVVFYKAMAFIVAAVRDRSECCFSNSCSAHYIYPALDSMAGSGEW